MERREGEPQTSAAGWDGRRADRLDVPAAVEERLTEENLVFALPPELRKDLKRASA